MPLFWKLMIFFEKSTIGVKRVQLKGVSGNSFDGCKHCWLFYDYYLANKKQMKQNDNKMARAFLRSWNLFMKIQYELLKTTLKRIFESDIYLKLEANKEFMENLSLHK